MNLSRSVRRVAVPLTFSLTIGGVGAIAPSVAQAAATGLSRCNGQDKVVERSVKLTKNKFVPTHLKTVNLGPGVKYSRSVTLTHETTLSASVSGDVKATGGIHWKLVDLGAEVHESIALSVSHTSTKSVTESFNVPARKKRTKWVFYVGRRDVRGHWYQLTCSRAPGHGTEYRGNTTSYGSEAEGAIICNHKLYKSGSESYIVARAAGC